MDDVADREACGSCYYARQLEGLSSGRCCRFPPSSPGSTASLATMRITREFPIIQPGWWCGEYRRIAVLE